LLFLFRFLAFVGVFWLLKKILAFLVGKSRQASQPRREAYTPNATVKDPVCGMYMDPALALRQAGKNGDVYFCSETCRQRYSGQ
jgi:YHS domain-containing protein